MKIFEYSYITELLPSDLFITETSDGTRVVDISDITRYIYENREIYLSSVIDSHNVVGIRRNIYRGKYLGDIITDEQWSSIEYGTFDDMFIGDYWILKDKVWRICDFDYWLNSGKTRTVKHHIVLMPDNNLDYGKMNETNTTEGGYYGSLMRGEGLNTSKEMIFGLFGSDHVLSYDNTISNGVDSGIWTTSTIELPNEVMMYGSYHQSVMNINRAMLYDINNQQLSLMRLQPYFTIPLTSSNNRQWNWLSDVANSSSFVVVSDYGSCSLAGASNSIGIRPVFGICSGD